MLDNKMNTTSKLSQIVAVAYFSHKIDPAVLRRIQRFLQQKAVGDHRWGRLYRYHKVDLDHFEDMTSLLKLFPKAIEGYKDLSDCPEPSD